MNANARSELLVELRAKVSKLERKQGLLAYGAVLQTGAPAIDAALPGGGLSCAALHEVAGRGPEIEHGGAAALMVAGLLARASGSVVWVMNRRDLFVSALEHVGLAAHRVLFVDAGKSVLLAMEEALRHSGLAGVVGEIDGRFGLTASRRLQLAAEASGVTAFALRRRRFDDPDLMEPIAAVTRWRIACQASSPPAPKAPAVMGIGAARWRLDLVRCRGGAEHSWIVEACDAQGRLTVVADMAHGSAAPTQQYRAAG